MELKPLFDSFYDKLILRDLFGKAVPGLLFMMCGVVGLLGSSAFGELVDRLTLPSWVVAAGLAWVVGFALQYLGEVVLLLRTHPRCGGRFKDRDSFYPTWAAFHEQASPHEKIHAERLNVIKEACGNAAVSLACAAAFFIVGSWQRQEPLSQPGPLVVVSVILFFCLLRMHVIHVERYGQFLVLTTGLRAAKTVAHQAVGPHNLGVQPTPEDGRG